MGHGISDEMRSRIFEISREFFAKSKQEKETIAIGEYMGRGYQRIGENVTKGLSDYHEGIDLYREVSPDHPLYQAHTGNSLSETQKKHAALVLGKNQWPSPEFKEAYGKYFDECLRVGKGIVKIFGCIVYYYLRICAQEHIFFLFGGFFFFFFEQLS